MPIQDLIVESKIVESSTNEIACSLKVMLNRNELLTNYKWKKLVREIKELPLMFPVNPLLAEMRNCLERINATTYFYEEQFRNLKESANNIQQLIKPTKDLQGIPCVFRFKDKPQIIEKQKKNAWDGCHMDTFTFGRYDHADVFIKHDISKIINHVKTPIISV